MKFSLLILFATISLKTEEKDIHKEVEECILKAFNKRDPQFKFLSDLDAISVAVREFPLMDEKL